MFSMLSEFIDILCMSLHVWSSFSIGSLDNTYKM
jgi:hypothetical protein